jgi:hypothetical protein
VEAAALLELAEGVEEPGQHDEDFLSAPVQAEQVVEPLVGEEAEFDRFVAGSFLADEAGTLAEEETAEIRVLTRIHVGGHGKGGRKERRSAWPSHVERTLRWFWQQIRPSSCFGR